MSEQKIKLWAPYETVLFRTAFIYFFIQAFPLDWKYYRTIFSIDWLDIHFQDLFKLTTYSPAFFASESISSWGIESFANWGIVLTIALIGSVVWYFVDNKKKEYNQLYYWLRVLLRYRLAIGIIGYGVLKIFKVQLPEPTLSDLHTSYGDYLPWKIYSLTTGIGGAFYEQSIGLIEIFAGLLLLFRKTATIGASVIIFVLTNIVLANFAYEIGEHVYSAYLLSIALFLLIYDLPRLYSVFVKRTFTLAAGFKPVFSATWIGSLRTGLKSAFIVFVIFYGIKTEAGLRRHNWPFPETSGLSNAHGFYDVSDFKINNKTIPYSQTDPIRWNNVVLEKWNTLSIKRNVAAAVDLSPVNLTLDSVRNFESAGNGGRHFFTYTLDTLARRIDLYNKNNPSENLDFHYTRPDNSTIILYGKNEQNDSLKIVLKKTARRYLLKEGRRKPIRIN